MPLHLTPIRVKGTKTWCKLFADNERELKDTARRLRLEIKSPEGFNGCHLDLTLHQRELAVRLGAREDD